MSILRTFNGRVVILAVVLAFFATSMYGFAAANTVEASKAGKGSGAISGYAVTGVKYTTTDGNVTAVNFLLNDAAATVKAQLVSGSGSWYACADDGDTETTNGWKCTISPGVDSATANSLSVNAAQ